MNAGILCDSAPEMKMKLQACENSTTMRKARGLLALAINLAIAKLLIGAVDGIHAKNNMP